MRIAICDNDHRSMETLQKMINTYSFEKDVDIYIDSFSFNDQLIDALDSENPYDMIFWDDRLHGMKCAVMAVHLREKLNHDRTLLVFPLLYSHILLQLLYRVGPVTFTEKTYQADGLYYLFDYFLYRERMKKTFLYTYNKEYRKVFHKDIVFFESIKRRVKIHTVSGEEAFISTVENVLDQLQGSSFLQVHQSYVVNMDFIKSITSKTVTLLNGQKIPISYSRSVDTRQQFTAYHRMLPKELVPVANMCD